LDQGWEQGDTKRRERAYQAAVGRKGRRRDQKSPVLKKNTISGRENAAPHWEVLHTGPGGRCAHAAQQWGARTQDGGDLSKQKTKKRGREKKKKKKDRKEKINSASWHKRVGETLLGKKRRGEKKGRRSEQKLSGSKNRDGGR